MDKVLRPKNRSGFTLLELVLGMGLFAIIGLGSASIFYLDGSLIKRAQVKAALSMEAHAAVTHLMNNIASSAWVVVTDKDHIELHSHTYPKIRKYSFEGGMLKYQEGNDNPVVIAQHVSSDKCFQGVGNERPNKRFKRVKVSFSVLPKSGRADTDQDTYILSAFCVSEEGWDVVYVSATCYSRLCR